MTPTERAWHELKSFIAQQPDRRLQRESLLNMMDELVGIYERNQSDAHALFFSLSFSRPRAQTKTADGSMRLGCGRLEGADTTLALTGDAF